MITLKRGKFRGITGARTCVVLIIVVSVAFGASRYTNHRTHSEITASVVANIRKIVAAGSSLGRHATRFIKVGDSITKSDKEPVATPNSPFLCQCICPDHTAESQDWDYTRNLDRYAESLTPALHYFLSDTLSDGSLSFNRPSSAAAVGMYADWAVDGSPSPLRTEIDAVDPQFAVIMYGANDAGGYGSLRAILNVYVGGMRRIVDSCIAAGVVPVLMATCPRTDKLQCTLAMGYLVRALAQQYQVPFIDYYRVMMPLSGYGLQDDGVHPNYYDYNRSCWFTDEGLTFGYNMRNLVTLEAFGRLHAVVTASVDFLDMEPDSLAGSGTGTDPFIVPALPFIDVREMSPEMPSVTYSLTLTRSVPLRALATDQDSLGMTISFTGSDGAAVAASTGEPQVDKTLTAGTCLLTVEASTGRSGVFQLVLHDTDDDGTPKESTANSTVSLAPVVRYDDLLVRTTRKTLAITVPHPGTVTMVDSRGRSVYRGMVNGGIIRWTAPSSGIYLCAFSSGTTQMVRSVAVY